MFEPLTLSVGELAERWKMTPRQILDLAQQMAVPLYFQFDGLVFDLSDEWLRHGGDWLIQQEIKALEGGIAQREARIARSARGECSQWEDALDSDGRARERALINKDQKKLTELLAQLEQRETDRRRRRFRGNLRAAPKTLFDLATQGSSKFPHKAFDALSPVHSSSVADSATSEDIPIWDGRLMVLESEQSFPDLTVDSLFSLTVEIKAIEAAHTNPNTPTPVQRATAQDEAILQTIRQRGYNPLELPVAPAGRSGVKAEVRTALVGQNNLFPAKGKVFDKAWQRLRDAGDISDS